MALITNDSPTIKKLFNYAPIRFLFIGCFGFAMNTILLYALWPLIGLLPARIIAYILVVSMTWILNRHVTFHSKDRHRVTQWLRYLLVYLCSGALNITTFALLTQHFYYLHQHPILPLAFIAVVVATFNYVFSNHFAFKLPFLQKAE